MKVKVNISLFFALLLFSISSYAGYIVYKPISHTWISDMPFRGTPIESGDHVDISRQAISQTTMVDSWFAFGDMVKWTWTGPIQSFSSRIEFIKYGEIETTDPDNPIEVGCWIMVETGTCWNGTYSATRFFATDELTEEDLGAWNFNLEIISAVPDQDLTMNVGFFLTTAELREFGGNKQTAKPATELASPFEIRLLDSHGEPLKNQPVKFQITSQPKLGRSDVGATIEENVFGSTSSSDAITATTDDWGFASAYLTHGTKEGIYGVTATATSAKFQSIVFVSNTDIALGFDIGKQLGKPCRIESCGNPINIAIGNKYQQETDMSNIAPSLLEFTRSYNSMGGFSSEMGNGWQHNYNRTIETVTSGNGPSATTTAFAKRFDGKRYTFAEENGLFVTDPDVQDTLVQDANGWTYTEDNTIERYDAEGRLVSITYLGGKGVFSYDNPDGRTVHLSYNAEGQLDTVTDDIGASLSFTYDILGRVETVTDQAQRTWQYIYSIIGNLEKVINPDLTERIYHYEDLLNNAYALTGITDERGNRYATWAYDSVDGKAITSYHGNNVDRIDVVYNDGTSRTVTNSRGGITNYQVITQNDSSLVTSVEGSGCATCASTDSSFIYDAYNNKAEVTVKGVTTQYQGYGETKYPRVVITAAGTPEQSTTTIFYDSRFDGLETLVIGESVYPPDTAAPYNTLIEKVYDGVGNLLSITENGFTPDADGWGVSGEALTRTTTFYYEGPLGQVSLIDGPRTDVIDTTQFEYYPNVESVGLNRGRLKQVTNALGQLVRSNIQYSATGKIKSETRLNGKTITYTYHPGNDRLWTMTESNGAESETTRWRYHNSGEVWDITTDYGGPNSTIVIFGYDEARRLTSIRDGKGNYRNFILDSEGNVEREETFDAGNTLHQRLVKTFDAYNRLETVSQANETVTYSYAADHTVSSQLDGKNVTTRYSYDGLKRLASTSENAGISTLSTTQNYDKKGNLIKVNDGAKTLKRYDDFGNLRYADIDNVTGNRYTYDEAGNRLTDEDWEQRVIQYQYDALNRLTNVDAPGTADDIVYGYDTCLNGQGLLCSMTMASGTTTYAYDGLGRVINHQGVGYSYDSAGRTKTMTYPSGSVISYDYDLAGQIQSINDVGGTAIAFGISYEPFGPVNGFTYGNGLTYSAAFDAASRPTQQATPGLLDRSYNQYDGNGNLLQLNETKNSVTTLDQFSYDWGDRLQTASGLFGARDYSYESPNDFSYSNRASHDEGSEFTPYAYDVSSFDYGQKIEVGVPPTETILYQLYYLEGPRIICLDYDLTCEKKTVWDIDATTTSQSSVLMYDLSGNGITKSTITRDGCVLTAYTAEEIIIFGLTETHYYDCSNVATNWGYDYSAFNQINRALLEGVEQASYQYNALRQRVSKTLSDGSVTQYVYGLDGLLLAELDGLNNVIKEYIYLSGKLLAVRDFSSGLERLYYAHTDHLGLPRLLTNASGQTVWSGDFDPFGKVAAIDEDVDGDTFNVSLNIRFPGQYHDAETGLYYNWNRYYDPEVGQYTSSDPIGIDGGLNVFAYVGGNPVGFVDFFGLAPGESFDSEVAAAKDAYKYARDNYDTDYTEYGTFIYKNECGKYSYEEFTEGNYDGTSIDWWSFDRDYTASFHTHPDIIFDPDGFLGFIETDFGVNENFSPPDFAYAKRIGRNSYLGTPDGALKGYNPKTNKTKTY